MALFPLLRSSSFKFDNICFKALRYSDENDEENLSVVHVGVGDLGSLQNLHLILWNWLKRDWRVISRCYEPPWCWCCCRCWRRFCAPSRLSLLASAPFLDVLTTAGIPVMCADESICWIENRISPHWQLHFHHVNCTCTYIYVVWFVNLPLCIICCGRQNFSNIFDMMHVCIPNLKMDNSKVIFPERNGDWPIEEPVCSAWNVNEWRGDVLTQSVFPMCRYRM